MTNLQIAELLRDVAAAYQLQDSKKNFFKIAAYERAADAVEHSSSELKDIWDEGKLEDVPGVGPSIAQHLSELFKTGKSKHFDQILKDIPKEAFKLMLIPGIGIKTAVKLLNEGAKSEIAEKLEEADRLSKKEKRQLLPYASLIASEIIDYMRGCKFVDKIDPLGSLRRRVATVGDIDISVSTINPIEVLNHFVKYPKAQKVLEKGTRSAGIIVPGNIQVDLMVETPDAYGSLLQHFTGSKHHNIALRELALKKGYSLSDYGIRGKDKKLKKFETEKDLYDFLGLDYIEPELREDTGEIEMSIAHSLPSLVGLKDVKGDLQIHSDFDIETSHDVGESSMEQVVEKAKQLGYEYIAFTEHNPSKMGHTPEQVINLLRKKEERVREKNWGIKVFNSLEIDINKDGSLSVTDKGLETLDFALVSIHSVFDLPRDEMTKRILNALAHPKIKIFAHPTARKIQEREGIELDWPKIFDFCLKNNKWIEINCDPMRLDLPDVLVRDAVKLGVKLTLGTDAHHKDGLNNMTWGVNVARRGWAEKKDIINTLNLTQIEKLLK